MKPGGGRRKGHDFEREVAQRMRAVFGEARRGIQTRDGTCEAPDVILPQGVPLAVECKRGRRPNIPAALAQAGEFHGTLAVPLAITQADRERAIASMWLDDLEWLLAEWHSLKMQAAHLAAASDEVMGRP